MFFNTALHDNVLDNLLGLAIEMCGHSGVNIMGYFHIYFHICAKCMVYGCTVTYIYVHKSALRLIWCPERSVNMHVCNLGQTVNSTKWFPYTLITRLSVQHPPFLHVALWTGQTITRRYN